MLVFGGTRVTISTGFYKGAELLGSVCHVDTAVVVHGGRSALSIFFILISNLERSCKDSQGAPVTPRIHWRRLLWGSPRLSPSLPPAHLSILTHIYSQILFPDLLGVGWRHCPFTPSLLRTRIFSHYHSAFVTLKIVMLRQCCRLTHSPRVFPGTIPQSSCPCGLALGRSLMWGY